MGPGFRQVFTDIPWDEYDARHQNNDKEQMIPMSVIEDIKAEIETEKNLQITIALESEEKDEIYTHLKMAQILAVALEIIDRHISGKENGLGEIGVVFDELPPYIK